MILTLIDLILRSNEKSLQGIAIQRQFGPIGDRNPSDERTEE